MADDDDDDDDDAGNHSTSAFSIMQSFAFHLKIYFTCLGTSGEWLLRFDTLHRSHTRPSTSSISIWAPWLPLALYAQLTEPCIALPGRPVDASGLILPRSGGDSGLQVRMRLQATQQLPITIIIDMAMGQNCGTLVNIKIDGKWMFIHPNMAS